VNLNNPARLLIGPFATRKCFLTIIFFLVVKIIAGQAPVTVNWTWMKGADKTNDSGYYGQLGHAADTNNPRSRSGALTWTDTKGITWLYGGHTYIKIQRHIEGILLNDFWTYNPTSNEWTWLGGLDRPDKNIPVVYGMQGVPSSFNTPGARANCFTWIPGDGKFWFYDPAATEIWNYNPLTSEWTWVKGKNSSPDPSYGKKGVPASTNSPGTRNGPGCWKDKSGLIWVMSGAFGDDMWTYDHLSNNWTWMKGDTGIVFPRYGTFRTEDFTNTPGGGVGGYTWTDIYGDFWVYLGIANALWKFNFETKNWAWMKGSGQGFDEPNYGSKGIEDKFNNPGERGGGMTWVDQQNNLWLMGGDKYHETLDELWRFNTTTLSWTWVRGADEPTSYGIKGVASPQTFPHDVPAHRHGLITGVTSG
jgi:hypothetical protein